MRRKRDTASSTHVGCVMYLTVSPASRQAAIVLKVARPWYDSRSTSLLVILMMAVLGACGLDDARAEFENQLELCIVAENNGLLETAHEGCQSALSTAEAQEFAPGLISDILYRLGRIERQRSNFLQAEQLIRKSIAITEQSEEATGIGLHLIQLALTLAGQARWTEGAEVLLQASPLMSELTGRDRKTAAGAFSLYAVRMASQGKHAQVEQFEDIASELAGDPKSNAT